LFIDETLIRDGRFIAILESGDRKERPEVRAAFFISGAFSEANERGSSSQWAVWRWKIQQVVDSSA
jgi:hypothetical protein